MKKDIHSSNYADKEEKINYLEMVITFGAVSKEITENFKESRFSMGKYARTAFMRMSPGTENIRTTQRR